MNRIKKSLITGAAATAIFGATYGLAASLGLTSDTLGAGNVVVAACQVGAFNATYQPTYAAGQPGYQATTVTLTGMTSGCQSKAYKATLYGAGGASLLETTGTMPVAFGPVAISFAGVNAASVTGIAVVISG